MPATALDIAGSTAEGAAAARRSLGLTQRHRVIGALAALAVVQSFFFLVVVDNSPLVPGLAGATIEGDMTFYLVLMGLSFFIIGFAPALRRGTANLATGGSLTGFMLSYGVVLILAWVLLGLAGRALGVVYVPIPGATRLAALVLDAAFVSATEEVLFRMAFPLVMNAWISTSILFPLFHLPVDVAAYGGNVELLASAFVQRAIAGAVLWVIYSRVNVAAAMAAHFTYDAWLQGALPMGAPLGLTHLGLVPV